MSSVSPVPPVECSSSALFIGHWEIYQIQALYHSLICYLCARMCYSPFFKVFPLLFCAQSVPMSASKTLLFLIQPKPFFLHGLSDPSRNYIICGFFLHGLLILLETMICAVGTVFFNSYYIWHCTVVICVCLITDKRRAIISYNLFLCFQSLEYDTIHKLSTRYRCLHWTKCVIAKVWLWTKCSYSVACTLAPAFGEWNCCAPWCYCIFSLHFLLWLEKHTC